MNSCLVCITYLIGIIIIFMLEMRTQGHDLLTSWAIYVLADRAKAWAGQADGNACSLNYGEHGKKRLLLPGSLSLLAVSTFGGRGVSLLTQNSQLSGGDSRIQDKGSKKSALLNMPPK